MRYRLTVKDIYGRKKYSVYFDSEDAAHAVADSWVLHSNGRVTAWVDIVKAEV